MSGGAEAVLRVLRRVPREVPVGLGLILAGAAATRIVPVYAHDWSLWMIYGLLALSFTFVWGHAGIFSFGQAAFFGIGGYAYGVASIDLSTATGESISALLIGAVTAMIAAAILGYFIFYGNVGDVYVAIITLAVTLVLLTFMSSTADPKYHIGTALIGGYNGMIGVPPVMVGGSLALEPEDLFVLCVAIAVAVAMALRVLLRRPFGRVISAVRENEERTTLLGYDVRRYKLIAFVIGGGVAGLAGGLYAAWGMFINPSVFSLPQAAMVAIWVLVGGRTSITGAFAGVVLVQGLSSTLGGSAGDWTPIVLGGVLIVVVMLFPAGLVPGAQRLARRFVPRLRPRPEEPPAGAEAAGSGAEPRDTGMRPRTLTVTGLRKRFGGVSALNGVTAEFPAATVQCLIGPNGAGKSTCFNLLSGRYPPTAGEIRFGDTVITRMPAHARVRLGIGIKPQVPSQYGERTVFENLWLAAYGRSRDVSLANRSAARILDRLGLSPKATTPADALSHGERQWLDIGMVMAGDPVVMLLDEPTAGMTHEETMRTVELVRTMSEQATVIVVEHDMEFVRVLDAPVTMFHEGEVFARGDIEELRTDERVLDVYLGRGTVTDPPRAERDLAVRPGSEEG